MREAPGARTHRTDTTTEEPVTTKQLVYTTGNHYPVTVTDDYNGTYVETVTAPTYEDAVRSARFIYQGADSITVSETPVDEPITYVEPEEPEPAPDVAALTAARAVNAHPWLSAVTPDPDDADADLLITPPYPANTLDRPDGHIEGRITWNHTSTGSVVYHVALAYEPLGGVTVEDETTAEVGTGALAWLDLARPIAALMEDLRASGL